MGVAEDMLAEQLQMFPYLAFGIESSTGVVQVDLPLGIQASILRGAKVIEGSGCVEGRELLPEVAAASVRTPPHIRRAAIPMLPR